MTRKLAAAALISSILLSAATRVDMKTQAKNHDWSGAPSVRPFRTGTVLPLVCQTGEMFFKTDAAPGSNLYGCTAAGEWAAQAAGGSGGAGAAADAPLSVTRASDSSLSIGDNCTPAAVCNVRVGSDTYSFASAATVTVQAGTGTVYIYVAGDGVIAAGAAAEDAPAIQCTNCRAEAPVSSFPLNAIPIGFWHAADAVWAGSGTDARALLSTPRTLAAGTNITITETGNTLTIAADPPAGSGTELQYLKNGKPGAVQASSVNAGAVRLGGAIPADSALLTLGDAVTGGHSAGTALAINAPAEFTGDLVNWMTGGTSRLRVTALGDVILPGSAMWNSSLLQLSTDGAESAIWGNYSGTAGSSVRIAVAGQAASNEIRVGAGSGPASSLVVNGLGKMAMGTVAPAPAGAANGPDLIIADATAGTGDTQVVVSAGAAQSRPLTMWTSSSAVVGARVSAEGALQNLPFGVQPACSEATRGMLWHSQGAAGVKDDVVVCAKDAADVYEWRVLF